MEPPGPVPIPKFLSSTCPARETRLSSAVPPTPPLSARTAHEVARQNFVNLTHIAPPWDASTRAFAFPDNSVVTPLMETLRGPREKIHSLIDSAPNRLKESLQDKKILLAYFLMQVAAEGNYKLNENLTGINNLIDTFDEELSGIYFQSLYLTVAIKIYQIVHRATGKLSQLLQTKAKTPQILSIYNLSIQLSPDNLLLYENELLKKLREKSKKAPYDTEVKNHARDCLRAVIDDNSKNSQIAEFLLDFFRPRQKKAETPPLDPNEPPQLVQFTNIGNTLVHPHG